jgi:alpha-glucosidase
MRQQIATVVGLGLSGVPYSGSDIGGFSGVPDDELYLRWLQMSVFMPYCRTHSVRGVPPREPWCFGDSVQPLVAGWIRFRYRLLPYLYTLAHLATESGEPLVRPPWWPTPGPDSARDQDDSFLLGAALLVAPVTEPGARARPVPQPPGSWVNVWGDYVTDGASHAPLERIPVLARAGSIVPLDDGWADAGGPCRLEGDSEPVVPAGTLALDHAPHLLAFHCWPDENGDAAGVCIDDAGDGDSGGARRRDTVRVEGAHHGATATCTWQQVGDFPPPAQVGVVLHGLRARRAVADGMEVPVSGAAVICPPFSELTLEGLHTPPRRAG